jgi:hypothetical protein
MGASSIRELPVLDGCQEVAQPSKRLTLARRVEFIAKYQRRLAFQMQISNLVEGTRQFLRRLKLREVKSQLGIFVDAHMLCNFFYRERFASSGRAKYGHGKRGFRTFQLQVFLHCILDATHPFDLVPVSAAPLADSFDWNIGQRRPRTLADNASSTVDDTLNQRGGSVRSAIAGFKLRILVEKCLARCRQSQCQIGHMRSGRVSSLSQ